MKLKTRRAYGKGKNGLIYDLGDTIDGALKANMMFRDYEKHLLRRIHNLKLHSRLKKNNTETGRAGRLFPAERERTMMKKEELEKQFGMAMEEVAKEEYKAHFENDWNHFRLGCAFGTLIAYGKALGMDYFEARKIEQQQCDMVLLGQ